MLSILALDESGLDPLHVARSCFLFGHSSSDWGMKCEGGECWGWGWGEGEVLEIGNVRGIE